MNPDITFLIKGPIRDSSLKAINHYNSKLKSNIVLSTWNCREIERIKKLHENIKVISPKLPDKRGYYNNGKNPYYNILSGVNGLSQIETEYVVCLRSDEIYETIDPIIEKMLSNDNKIITTNTFFRKFKIRPFHCGDHVIAGKTKNVRDMFLEAEKYMPLPRIRRITQIYRMAHHKFKSKHFKYNILANENILTIPYLLHRGESLDIKERIPNIQHYKNIMKSHFDVVDNKELGKDSTISVAGEKFTPETYQDKHGKEIISNIDEL